MADDVHFDKYQFHEDVGLCAVSTHALAAMAVSFASHNTDNADVSSYFGALFYSAKSVFFTTAKKIIWSILFVCSSVSHTMIKFGMITNRREDIKIIA